jgi:precorrin-2 dehydrogenase/sirohydrochlorin ferrochelatase
MNDPESTLGNRSEDLRFLPVAIDLTGRPCLVVGGGAVGTRKVHTLLQAGAAVTVVSPTVTDELRALVDGDRVRWVQEPYRDEHLAGAFLVVTAAADDAVNVAVVEGAARREGGGILVCDSSSAERSQIVFGALLDAGGATVAVFTDGKAPARAREVRNRLAEWLEQHGTEGRRR